MAFRIYLLSLAFALLTNAPAYTEVPVIFEGLVVLATDGLDEQGTRTDEARAVLVDSELAHVPLIAIYNMGKAICTKDGDMRCWLPATPHLTLTEHRKEWSAWYLHGTTVSFTVSDAKGPIELVDFNYLFSPKEVDGRDKKKLGLLDDDIWDQPDSRVASRVDLVAGTLKAICPDRLTSPYGEKEKMANGFVWSGNVTSITLADIEARPEYLPLKILTKDKTEIRILNRPSQPPADPDTADHFREYYELTDKIWKPSEPKVPSRMKRCAAVSNADDGWCKMEVAEDAFCPPTTLGKKP